MARRNTGNMNGERYLPNTSPRKREVHDGLSHEIRPEMCEADALERGALASLPHKLLDRAAAASASETPGARNGGSVPPTGG